jgi:hypothetical protein
MMSSSSQTMTGDEFQQLFKRCLTVFGLRWADMELMEITVENDDLIFMYNGMQISQNFKQEPGNAN